MKFLIVILFLSFFVEQFSIIDIGSYSVTLADLATMGLIIVFMKDFVWLGKKILIPKNPIYLFIAIFFLTPCFSWISIMSRGLTPEFVQTIKSTFHFWFTVSVVIILSSYRMDIKTWNRAIKLFLIASILINVYAVYQLPARAFDLPFGWIQLTSAAFSGRGTIGQEDFSQIVLQYENFYRATSLFSEPSALAEFNVIIFALMIPPIIRKQKHFFESQKLNLTIIIFSIIGLFLTFSLTGLVGLFAVIFFILIYENKRLIPIFLKVLAGGIVLIVIVNQIVYFYTDTSVLNLFGERVSTIAAGGKHGRGIEGESFFFRQSSAMMGIQIWSDNPIFGYGYGNFQAAAKGKMMFSDIAFVSVLAELGTFGGLSFLIIFLLLAYYGMLLARKKIVYENEDLNRFASVFNPICIILIVVSFMSGNQVGSITLWIFIIFMTLTLNEHFFENNKYYEFSIFHKPLRDQFLKLNSTSEI